MNNSDYTINNNKIEYLNNKNNFINNLIISSRKNINFDLYEHNILVNDIITKNNNKRKHKFYKYSYKSYLSYPFYNIN